MDADERFLWCADPLAAPDWRWRRACALHRRPRRRRRRPDDPDWLPTLLALAETVYPSRRRRGLRLVIPPALIEALEVYQGGGQLRWELEARLLAGQTDEDITAATAVRAAVVAAYERHFFAAPARVGSIYLQIYANARKLLQTHSNHCGSAHTHDGRNR
jgi:hypothetical protein